MTTAPSSPPDGPTPSSLARLIGSALVLPVEVTGRLVEVVPAVIDKVPSAADRVRREVVLARFLGKMVVDQGVRDLRARLAPHDDDAVGSVAGARASSTASTPAAPTAPSVPAAGRAEPSGDRDGPNASTLALVDYDHLSSAQIVGKLEGLDAGERRAIERYERAGRGRRTILGKLAQLGADE